MSPANDSIAVRLSGVLQSLPEVELAYLFGSHAHGRERSESDIDVAVQVDAKAASRARETLATLFDQLGRVVPSDRLDLVILNGASSLLRHRVLSTGQLLFTRTPEARVRFATRTIQDYQDMQCRREFFYRKRVERLKEGAADGGSRDLLAQARRTSRLFVEAPRLPSDD